MVPRMLGWGVQKYANVPAWSNVSERLCPALKIPVSKLPSSAVAECGVGPSLVQVTVSPTLIVTDAGANSKSLIVTPVSAAAVARLPRPLPPPFPPAQGLAPEGWLGPEGGSAPLARRAQVVGSCRPEQPRVEWAPAPWGPAPKARARHPAAAPPSAVLPARARDPAMPTAASREAARQSAHTAT